MTVGMAYFLVHHVQAYSNCTGIEIGIGIGIINVWNRNQVFLTDWNRNRSRNQRFYWNRNRNRNRDSPGIAHLWLKLAYLWVFHFAFCICWGCGSIRIASHPHWIKLIEFDPSSPSFAPISTIICVKGNNLRDNIRLYKYVASPRPDQSKPKKLILCCPWWLWLFLFDVHQV